MLGLLLNQRYRLDSELGRGGMSVVYRGHDTLLGRSVAVKVLRHQEMDRDGWDSILREAQSAALLNHPNIVSVYDAGKAATPEGESIPFIVMELVEGVPLNQWPRRGLEEIVAVAKQVCDALAHAHDHEVIHRDLKPENILILPDGTAKLTDFGLAQSVASRLTSSGALVGTVFYISPEQAMGRHVDGRADRTTACLAEGGALEAEIDGRPGDAAAHFEEAARRWGEMGRPIDQAQALLGQAQNLSAMRVAEDPRAGLVAAKAILESLAAQLIEPVDVESFAHSRLVTAVDALLAETH